LIKVLLADDSAVVRAVLRDILQAVSDLTVVGEAGHGLEAVELTERLKPDIVIMDILMPVMDGLAAIEIIMARFPTPILVLSATMDDREVNHAFAAIRKGALDVMEKPGLQGLGAGGDFAATIIEKVRILSRVRVIRRWPSSRGAVALKPVSTGRERGILAIGASTGGPKAVMGILRSLPAQFGGAVFVVQHIASGFARGFAQWLNSESAIKVRLAVDGEPYVAGTALIAPNDCHMTLDGGKVVLTPGAPVNCCRPSIDVLFNSLAQEEGSRVVGVLLTGMGKDGAQGMGSIRSQGGLTIAQDEQSCAVYGMPRAAIALNAVDEVLPLASIPKAIARIFSGESHPA
jgi:two-component system, chemotaxis family, protein-glutamate methylesterase/glutaminase